MQDRASLYPGRVKLIPVTGQENTYDMVRADEPTQEGTQINKYTLLKDATAALYGLGADAVPDDVLAFLGKYGQYWWKRRVYTVAYEISLSTASSNVYFSNSYMTPHTVYYATDIEISSDGVVSLKNPQTLACPRWEQSLDLLTAVKGMYVCNTLTSNSSVAADSETVYLISSSATFSLDKNGNPYTDSANAQEVSTHPVKTIGEWVYIMSSDRNAYPDSGITGGYEYQYLGVPFENAVTSVKIATGSYVGTGVYGSSNPTSLTFDFVPKLIILECNSDIASTPYSVILIRDNPFVRHVIQTNSGDLSDSTLRITWSENMVSWYNELNAEYQMNSSQYGGLPYFYVAIG